ncbi:Uncharacterized protein PPKH_4195 [Pseudomonas putida]|nr:Uncharacterized protein PPKH_4195 [Pseudomonas putida]
MERARAQLALAIAEGVPNGCVAIHLGALVAPRRKALPLEAAL